MKTFTLIFISLFISLTANADDKVVPAGTTVVIMKDGKPYEILQLDTIHFILSREIVEKLYAKVTVNEDLKSQLNQCQKDVNTLSKKDEESSFMKTLKWGGIGGAVVGAFVLGLMIGH